MRPQALVIPVSLVFLVAACSTSSTPVDEATAPPTTDASTAAPTSAAAPTTAAGGSSSGGATGASLTGALGANNAFIITLVDDKGASVTALKAGTYQVKIKDTSQIHNFHLSGPGVDLSTTVPEIKETTWPVQLKAGTYTYECDPHPNMKHTFTVS